MVTIIAWLKATITIAGLTVPHWAFIAFFAGVILEYALGRSKNPRLRSIAAAVMNALVWGVKKTHVTDIPKIGTAVQAILDFVAPPPVTICKVCGGTGIESGVPKTDG